MQFLQDIIGLSYFHFYPAIEDFLPPGAKNQQLYRAIRDGEVSTDEEASQLIYGDPKAGKKYDMLKKRLKQQVADHYFQLLSQSNEGPSLPLKHRMDNLKQLVIARTLMGQGQYAQARQLLRYQQQTADTQFDLSMMLEGLLLLRQMAGYQGDRVRFRRYDAQLKKLNQQTYHLRELRGSYEVVRIEHRRRWPFAPVVVDLAQSCLAQGEQESRSNRHPASTFYLRMLKLTLALHAGNTTQLRRMLSLQKQHIERHPVLKTYDPVASADLLAIEYLSTNHPEDQSLVVQQTIHGSRDESLPVAAWLTLREIECIHWLRAKNYERAEQIAQQLASEEVPAISSHDKSRWILLRTYATYLQDQILEESLSSLENNLQPLLSDASGYGWQWTILKMLLWIKEPHLPVRSFLSLLDAYAQRHLARQSKRSAIFFQQLRAVIAHRRDEKEVVYQVDDLKLPSPSVRDSLQELIPCEILWRRVVDSTSNQLK